MQAVNCRLWNTSWPWCASELHQNTRLQAQVWAWGRCKRPRCQEPSWCSALQARVEECHEWRGAYKSAKALQRHCKGTAAFPSLCQSVHALRTHCSKLPRATASSVSRDDPAEQPKLDFSCCVFERGSCSRGQGGKAAARSGARGTVQRKQARRTV